MRSLTFAAMLGKHFLMDPRIFKTRLRLSVYISFMVCISQMNNWTWLDSNWKGTQFCHFWLSEDPETSKTICPLSKKKNPLHAFLEQTMFLSLLPPPQKKNTAFVDKNRDKPRIDRKLPHGQRHWIPSRRMTLTGQFQGREPVKIVEIDFQGSRNW